MKFFLLATIDGTDFVIRTNCCKKKSYSRAALTVTVAFSNDLFDWRHKYLEITAATKSNENIIISEFQPTLLDIV